MAIYGEGRQGRHYESFPLPHTQHLIIDEYRRHKHVSLDTLIEKGLEPSVDPSDRLVNMLDGKAALLLIQNLPPSYQKVMHMRYVQHLTLHEISLIMGKTKNTIAVQLHRGLVMLRRLYRKT